MLARLDRDPCDIEALVTLGALEFAVFESSNVAMEYLRRALTCDETSVAARYWLAKFLYHESLDWHECRRVLTDALELDPSCPDCLSLHAELLNEFGEPAEDWLEYIERALVRGTDWPILRYQRALGLFKVGRVAEADSEVKEGLRIVGEPRAWPPQGESTLEWYSERTIRGKGSDVVREMLLELQKTIK